jgi:hypothetical protein
VLRLVCMENGIPMCLGLCFWWRGVSGVLWVQTTFSLTASNMLAKDYNSLLGARIMQGFGTGPFEMLVPSSIGDMLVDTTYNADFSGTLCINEARGLPFKPCQCLEFPS